MEEISPADLLFENIYFDTDAETGDTKLQLYGLLAFVSLLSLAIILRSRSKKVRDKR